MVLVFVLGMVMFKYLCKFFDWNFMCCSCKFFLKGDYDDFVDLLEIQLLINELKLLCKSIEFMQQYMVYEEINCMLNCYVNIEDNLYILICMVRLSYEVGYYKDQFVVCVGVISQLCQCIFFVYYGVVF